MYYRKVDIQKEYSSYIDYEAINFIKEQLRNENVVEILFDDFD